MKYYLGVDIGSLTVKVVLIDEDAAIVVSGVHKAGYRGREVAGMLVAAVLDEAGVRHSQVSRSVVTGYGRVNFDGANEEISEISCHARGAYHLYPEARTVIDIGGQDSKAISLAPSGQVVDFAMNDKCAAGTGRFLEVMAGALEVPVTELGKLGEQARHAVRISSTCTVFAESEVISHLAHGVAREDIIAGLHQAIASRILGLAYRVGMRPCVVLTGGVAYNTGVARALEAECHMPMIVPSNPQIVGALGAALFARLQGR